MKRARLNPYLKTAAATLAMLFSTGAASAEKKEEQPAEENEQEEKVVLEIPLEIDQAARGLSIPYIDLSGRLQMQFDADWAKRLDENHIKMSSLKIATFDEQGEPELLIRVPESRLNLDTRVIESDESVTVQRRDFELHGEGLEFDTQTKSGKLLGRIYMIIYNRGALK